MKKPLVVLAGALLLAVLCAYLYSLVQPVAESDTLKVQWHAGGGVRGVVTGKFQDAHGKPIPHQTFKLWTEMAHIEGQTDDDGWFTLQVPNTNIRALEVPGSEVLQFGTLMPSAVEGLTLSVTVR